MQKNLEYHRKREDNIKRDIEKTEKKRAKRIRRKLNKKGYNKQQQQESAMTISEAAASGGRGGGGDELEEDTVDEKDNVIQENGDNEVMEGNKDKVNNINHKEDANTSLQPLASRRMKSGLINDGMIVVEEDDDDNDNYEGL
mmetsp:Transcript_26791/g.22065  ORF Transcript_26791/g.22065 Transcript_26791/m.22065 type:complete len:142 (-) Transcript_26791:8-433(-)